MIHVNFKDGTNGVPPGLPGTEEFKRGVDTGYRLGLIDGKWKGLWTGLGIGTLFGSGVVLFIIMNL